LTREKYGKNSVLGIFSLDKSRKILNYESICRIFWRFLYDILKEYKMANALIRQLSNIKGLNVVCPNCNEVITIKQAKLFDINDKYSLAVQKVIKKLFESQKERFEELNNRREEIKARRKEIKNEPETTNRGRTTTTDSVNFGQIIEKIVPSIDTFPYNQKDCRQLFDPIDYIVFNGLHNNGNIESVEFIDIKSGKARLKQNQKEIKGVIENSKLRYINIEDIKNE
jgi:predicted Holliday junction resolvase-like endonuclease